MRIPSNKYISIMNFALQELNDIYDQTEIRSLIYMLFEEYLNVSKTDFIIHPNKSMSESELLDFHFALKDLKKGKPIQYVLGYCYFNDLKFFVNNQSLIPRPETEEIVNTIIDKEKQYQHLKILDIGTGTGCIPISLATAMPQHHYEALDYKSEIIDLAKRNAAEHRVHISFSIIDILQASASEIGNHDVIISNPPYVLESEKEFMHSNVLDFEPSSALYVPNDNALLYYKRIVQLALQCLSNNGRLYFEVNENFAEDTAKLLSDNAFSNIQIHTDIHEKRRYISSVLIRQ